MKSVKRYKLTFDNSSTLSRIFRVEMSPAMWWLSAAGVVAAIFFIAGFIIWITPLKRTLPGYMEPMERESTIAALSRCDSLQEKITVNQRYIDNIRTILNTDRPVQDSLSAESRSYSLSIDSLMDPSSEEEKFVKMMEQRERYNISRVAPMAAESIILSKPADSYTVAESDLNGLRLPVLTAGKSGIYSIADGIIIDTSYSMQEKGYAVVIQHSKGFISRYSGLGQLLTSKGKKVKSGEAIATNVSATARGGNKFWLEIWQDGIQLPPASIITISGRERSRTI